MEEHLSPNFGKRKKKLLFELEKKKDKKTKNFSKRLQQINQSPQYNRTGQIRNSANCKSVEIGQISTIFENVFALPR